MVKHLIPQVPKMFKANLHTHSTISDGRLTPEEIRDAYRDKGYSILALTDHSVCVAHQDLNLPDFLMITGCEIDIDDRVDPTGDVRGRNRHFCILSKDPNRQWIPYRDEEPIPSSVPYESQMEIGNIPRIYSAEAVNNIIAECNRQGFLVTYNHPVWSLESYPEYAPMKGLWGMEYRNGSCVQSGYDENNSRCYQDLLRLGNRLVPICADDTHRPATVGMAWTVVAAPELTYDSVMGALEHGDLYSSCGPEIHSLTWEDGKLRITCSACRNIQLICHKNLPQHAFDLENASVTEAEFDMSRWLQNLDGPLVPFFRVLLIDADGNYAVTRAYFPDEIL